MKKPTSLQAIFSFLAIFVVFSSVIALFYPDLLQTQNFLHWDAEHYDWIKNYGYKDFRVAFFPLFPMIWKFSNLGVYGIVLVNILVFYFSFYFLTKSLESTATQTLLYLSIPSFCFFYLPYSEAFFFASCTLLIFGLRDKRLTMSLLGLFLCTLSRPTFTIFIPALFIAEYFSSDFGKALFKRLSLYCVTILAAILAVAVIQFYFTGAWFEFFSVQKYWGNELQIPKFPLKSWSDGLILRLDAAGFSVGLILIIFLVAYFFDFRKIRAQNIPKEVLFCIAYLGGITILVLFLRGGVLASLSRYIFATPCIIVALDYYLKQKFTFDKKILLYIFLGLIVFFLCFFGAYVHLKFLLKFILLSAYLTLLFSIKSKNSKLENTSFIVLVFLNLFFQGYFWIRFLEGGWVA
jgi:hypothetical protein